MIDWQDSDFYNPLFDSMFFLSHGRSRFHETIKRAHEFGTSNRYKAAIDFVKEEEFFNGRFPVTLAHVDYLEKILRGETRLVTAQEITERRLDDTQVHMRNRAKITDGCSIASNIYWQGRNFLRSKKTDLFDCYGAWIKDKPVMPPELKIGLARNNYDFLVILK
ncbi:hypothetical protein HOC01_05140 [archaeon]|jgi:hypothetical protein|nr:hypothetical protein [archaeon]MBT6698195.1 hypothetical protein [archaeon]